MATPVDGPRPLMSSAAGRWSQLWTELEFSRATFLDRAPGVKADVYEPRVELTPQLFDLLRGRRFITIGMKYRDGLGLRGDVKVVRAFGQFINIPFADWAVADQVWEVLQTGDMGVSFGDLSTITGDLDQASKAADQREKERWIQRVWELKNRLEEIAARRTRAALERIAAYIDSRPETAAALSHGSVLLPASLLGPDSSTEAVTRFRINQGMYGDQPYFIDRPVNGRMTVHLVPTAPMVRRAAELRREVSHRWLNALEDKLEELMELTSGLEGAALARAIESAAVTKKLDEIVGTFGSMWRNPLFSATAEFEVVADLERRATKYMEIMVQRALRFLLKPAIRGLGVYPYPSIDRSNYSRKVQMLQEALRRAKGILQLYAQARSVSEFNAALKERQRLIGEFQTMIRAS